MADLTRLQTPDYSSPTADSVEKGLNLDNNDIKNLYSLATKQRSFFYGSTPPSQPNVGDKWHDSASGYIKMWDGDSWEYLDSKTVGGHEAGTAANNVLVLDSNGKVPKANLPYNVPVGGTILWKYGISGSNPTKDGVVYTDWQVDTDFSGLMPLGVSASHALNSTGGEETVTLTTDQIPAHQHEAGSYHVGDGDELYTNVGLPSGGADTVYSKTSTVGGGKAHNNMPPFRAIYFITRIA